jgi:WD40 repeat protein
MKPSLAGRLSLAALLTFTMTQYLWASAQTTKKKTPAQQDRGMTVKKTPPPEKSPAVIPPQPRAAQNSSSQPQLFIQLGHSQIVTSVAASGDGRFILTGSFDRTARLWDAATGAELKVFTGHTDDVTALAFSPDSRLALTASKDNTARLWDLATGAQIGLLTTRTRESRKGITSVAFSPDGRSVLLGCWDTNAYLWDVQTAKLIKTFAGAMRFTGFVSSLAFSPDGQKILLGTGDDVSRLLDATTGQELQRFPAPASLPANKTFPPIPARVKEGNVWVTAVAFSPDGRSVLTGSRDRSARLWDAATGKELRRFTGHSSDLSSVAFSADGRFILTASDDGTARLWNAQSGAEVRRFTGHTSQVSDAVFAADGQTAVSTSFDKTARLWNIYSGEEQQVYSGLSAEINAAVFSPNGQYILTGSGSFDFADANVGHLWDLQTGAETRRLLGHKEKVNTVAFTPDGQFALTGSGTGYDKEISIRLWNPATGEELRRFEGHTGFIRRAVFSPDGRFLATGSNDSTARLWDAASGRELKRINGYMIGLGLAFSPDSRLLAVNQGKDVGLYDVATGSLLRSFSGHQTFITSVAFSPDGRFLLTGSQDKTARLWDVESGASLRQFTGHKGGGISPEWGDIMVAFSPDGKFILTGSEDKTARLWDAKTGAVVRQFSGHSQAITDVSFSPDGRWIVTASEDSTTRLWDAANGKEFCRLISFRNGDWVVVNQEGRFDTNNLEAIRGLYWLMPDDALNALPLEIFMREYYEPRLLARLLAGEKFQPVKTLSELNRAQPKVKITKIEPQKDAPNSVAVTVEVANTSGQMQRNGRKVAVESGVFNLKLFRDGQLVGYEPKSGEEIKVDAQSGKTTITFANIKLPRKGSLKQLEFSAYAFNADKIKSKTDRKIFEIASPLATVKGRAYLVSFGVNAYENRHLDLSFAANDARQMQKVLSAHLAKTDAYRDIVQVPLIADAEVKNNTRVVTEKSATKINLKTVFELLSGKAVAPELLKGIPNGDKLRRAEPEDLVILSFAGHGVADEQGVFYFVPYDSGVKEVAEFDAENLRRSISSDELSQWLRDIDAGEMVLIADACQSSATVDAGGFKPGPMGSRGLGQLAYDKGMRILASTQADDVALESNLIKQGLLSYALIHDGIEAGQSDFKPRDKTIMLAEWLGYGLMRMPALHAEIKKGELQNFGAGSRALVITNSKSGSLTKKNWSQKPSLFDFSKKKPEVMLVRMN